MNKSNDEALGATTKDLGFENLIKESHLILKQQQINFLDAHQFSQRSLNINNSKISPIKQYLNSK